MSNIEIGTTGLVFNEPLIFEKSVSERVGVSLPKLDVPDVDINSIIDEDIVRDEIKGFPSLSEVEVVRHFTRLSQWNYGLDGGFYPLGSCTMKYNPKVNEEVSKLSGFTHIHPLAPAEAVQGALHMMYDLAEYLSEIGGMDKVSLQPAAGAHGEFAGMLMIKAFLEKKGEKRDNDRRCSRINGY